MIVNITDQTLKDIDCKAVVLHLFYEKKPSRGGAGSVDWRLNGFLSRLIKGDRIRGKDKELVILPSQGRLPAGTILALGLGKPDQFEVDKLKQAWKQAGKILVNLRLFQLAVAMPPQNPKLAYPEGGKLAQAIMSGLLEGIEQAGGKCGDFHLFFADFNELKTKENKNTFRREVSSFPGIQSIGF